eukprot:gene11076-biopygen8082
MPSRHPSAAVLQMAPVDAIEHPQVHVLNPSGYPYAARHAGGSGEGFAERVARQLFVLLRRVGLPRDRVPEEREPLPAEVQCQK